MASIITRTVCIVLLASVTGVTVYASGGRAADTVVSKDAPDLTAVRAKIKAKDFSGAVVDLTKLTETVQHADVYSLLGFSLRKSRDYKAALTFYQKALEFDPKHLGAHEYLGELYVETGQAAKARDMLAKLVVLCPRGCEEREDLEAAIKQGASVPLPKPQ